MFRREWRQQILVVALLAVAVAAAIGSITIVEHADNAAEDPEFGIGQLDADIRRLRSAKARRPVWPSPRSRSEPSTPLDTARWRSREASRRWTTERRIPTARTGGVLLALREGSYPTGSGEVAVTDGVAKLLGLEIGDPLALDGHRRTVVGIVENPRKLSDEFALVAPSPEFTPDFATVLVDARSGDLDGNGLDDVVDSFFGPGREPRAPAFAGAGHLGNDNPEAKPLAMVSVATVFLLLASLIAAAGFAVVAQRRLRQLGMLAAVGATQKHVRLALLANGAIVGAIAAVIGTIARSRGLARVRADARVGARPSRRQAQPALVADRDDRPACGPRGGGRRVVARTQLSPASRSCSHSRDDRRGPGLRATRPSRPQR